jgi:hypothetical protein
MKLYEFLQKIEDCGQKFQIELRKYNREKLRSTLYLDVFVDDYHYKVDFHEPALKERNERELDQDFTKEWKAIEKFIKKSLAKVAIDEE